MASVAGEVVGQIGLGFVVLLGVEREDGPEAADDLAENVAGSGSWKMATER